MNVDTSLWGILSSASPIVKFVIMLLFAASIFSWTIILQRWLFIKSANNATKKFEEQFWSGSDLTKFYQDLCNNHQTLHGLENIFCAGFSEYTRLSKQFSVKADVVIEGVQRAMRIVLARETALLEQHLSILASVGSTSPYVGLFGTVWGIMTSFRALSGVQQATIAMVAPGISEALITTALGLVAAIPAVLAYNHYANKVGNLVNNYDTFKEEFSSILHRKLIESKNVETKTL